ncbi:MAG: hypothetical protein F8N36_13825 [Desulfovibrio sp.]|uniref:FlhC family transcriptional regulator n=1 Tax=Desulfovibrio sp. TaxID=885 RepID=UPI00135DE13E|nr:FlhC family transcriptional regulator [Desulfovibrio sp.]MTJ93917.1 hypothetical protein [Desulfovibrio sp.]
MQTLRIYGSVDHQREAIAIELLRRNARAHVLKSSTQLSARRLQGIAEKIGVPWGGSTRGPLPQVSQVYPSDAERLNVRTFAPVYIGYAASPRASIDVLALISAHDFCRDQLGISIHIDHCWSMARDIRNGHIFRKQCSCGEYFFVCGATTREKCQICRGDGKPSPDPMPVHVRTLSDTAETKLD